MNKFIIILLILLSFNAHSSMREVWGRYFVANNIKDELDLITNLDLTLDTDNPNLSYWTLRSLLFFQLGKGWFLDLGPAYRGDFGSNIKYSEFRIIGSFHYLKNIEDWSFRNRLRFENRWIKKGPKGDMEKTDPFRFRIRALMQKNNLVNIDNKLFAFAGPEFFFEQNMGRDDKIDLGSIRWIFALGRLITDTLSVQVDYWLRQYVNQEKPNFGAIHLRFDQVF